MGIRDLLKPARAAVVFGLAALSLSACVTLYRDHGYIPTDEELAQIRVGVDTRDSVAEAVGEPGATGMLDTSGYYYVATRFRFYGPRLPKVIDRQLVAISFDTAGRVRNIERFGLEDGQVIPLQRRVTDSSVSDKTFIRQLLGNIGQVNPSQFTQ